MKLYWPNARFAEPVHGSDTISTYDGTLSLDEAKNQLNIWCSDYGFNIKEFWIDVYGDGLQKCERINIEIGEKRNGECGESVG